MATDPQKKKGPDGRMVALTIAATGLFWIGATWAGEKLDWSTRIRALMDLIALAGFVFALITLARLRRAQRNEGPKG